MASSNRLTRLKNIRDYLEKELEDAMAAIVATGKPKPSYNVAGRSLDWMGYKKQMQELIKEAQDQVIAAGADGGIVDLEIENYV